MTDQHETDPMQAWQVELENEQIMERLAIVKRIERGLATVEDARYVAGAFGLTTEWRKHGKLEQTL